MQVIQIAIFGGGGFAREVAWLAVESGDELQTYTVWKILKREGISQPGQATMEEFLGPADG